MRWHKNRVFQTLVVLMAVMMCSSESCLVGAEITPRALADHLIRHSEIDRGICAVLSLDDGGDVALEIARISKLLVNVRHAKREVAREIMKRSDESGYGIGRLAAEAGPLARLPYADRLIDLVVATEITPDVTGQLSIKEILRVLRPRGKAIIGKVGAESGSKRLAEWAQQAGADNITSRTDEYGSWIEFSKPSPADTDDWSHWEKGPDNNPVSGDAIIKAPYMTQFMTGPFYIGMPAITTAAGGRTFLAIGHIAHHRREWGELYTLIARNGYNGRELWRQRLPDGYLVHRSAFVATPDVFYMIEDDHCRMLDAETGGELGAIHPEEVHGQWKWMAISGDVLYFLAGKPGAKTETKKGDRSFGGWSWADLSRGYYKQRMPHGYGDTLAAYDLKQNKVLWTHHEQRLIDSRGMALRDGKLFFYCPDLHLRCLSASTGRILWTNNDPETLSLIEVPGRGLTSTPGFRTACMTVATPDALIIQGQTRMNVVAIATQSGSFLWTKKKITNNPNAIYLDDNVILGVGPSGEHEVIEPLTGEVKENLHFQKRACTRLTASTDSLFCRGEGLLRFDREQRQTMVDGAARPACNDGAIPANGLLYLGPWQCDCNLSLIGFLARCSAGDFRFDYVATESDRLQQGEVKSAEIQPFDVSDEDWWTYRANNQRSASTKIEIPTQVSRQWEYNPASEFVPTAPTAAGGLWFCGGDDGKVKAIDARTGQLCWEFRTPSPIKYPPTLWEGRAFFGSGDGYVYALEAATGREIWRFRAAPVERHVHAYGSLSSTWPAQSGVLVHDGVAYFAAGIVDYDGTYVYALDAKTGQIVWQNNSSGHLNEQLRKGVSVQGNLTIHDGQLLLASGNQISPARFDLRSGECLTKQLDNGRPKANNGKFVGVFDEDTVIQGGRILYSSARNVATKGSFQAIHNEGRIRTNFGGIPPAWNDSTITLVNFRNGTVACCDAGKFDEGIRGMLAERENNDRRRRNASLASRLIETKAIRWEYRLGDENRFEVLSLAVCPNGVVAVLQLLEGDRAQPQWFLAVLDLENGKPRYRDELHSEPLPGGLLVDRDGGVMVSMLDGSVIGYAGDAKSEQDLDIKTFR